MLFGTKRAVAKIRECGMQVYDAEKQIIETVPLEIESDTPTIKSFTVKLTVSKHILELARLGHAVGDR